MAATTEPKRLLNISDEELANIFSLIEEADSVELKLTVPHTDHRSATNALGVDPLEAQIRQVYFYDTPDLALNHAGVVVRARRVQGRDDDTVVKLRPVVPHELPESLRRSPNLVVEVDAMPGGYVCSASLKGTTGRGDVKDAAEGKRPIRKLYSKEQRAFFAEHAPDGVSWDDLTILGPITVFKLNLRPKEFGRKLVAEMWLYPDYSRIVELSTKCVPADAVKVAIESRLFLASKGVELSGDQQTKTRTALEFFTQG